MSTDLPAVPRTENSTSHRTGGGAAILAASLLWGTSGTAATFAPAGVSPLAIGSATISRIDQDNSRWITRDTRISGCADR